jgi:hypothetical protein
MKKVYANIEIFNANDISFARKGFAQESPLKSIETRCIVDFNTKMFCINQIIQDKLEFPVIERKIFRMNDSTLKEFEIVSDVIVKFENRQTSCRALVLPSNEELILGMIPLNGLDVKIRNQELIVSSESPMVNLPSIFYQKKEN